MFFDRIAVSQSEGCYLAHSVATREGRLAKGSLIDPALIQRLQASAIDEVVVAKLDPDDVHEDEAAARVARVLAGHGVRAASARTGRANLHATQAGLCHFDRETIIRANAIDEGITVATLPEHQWVSSGRMIATVKIIPYGVNIERLDAVIHTLSNHSLCVSAPHAHHVELIQTQLPTLKETVLDKTRRVTEQRLQQRNLTLARELRCAHDQDDLAASVSEAIAGGVDWLLIAGASAISDRNDVIPQAIVAAGGQIDRFGIPVDPGNLMLMAHIGQTTILGLPGCARSPRYNGLDQILDRLVCRLAVPDQWLNSLSVGGLLNEIADRPAPRVSSEPRQRVGGLLLAAGSSRRAGQQNKLLHGYRGQVLVAHAAGALRHSRVDHSLVVTGFEQQQVQAALDALPLAFTHNAAFDSGMASSLTQGLSTLMNTSIDAVIVCLGDMPHVTAGVIDQLIEAFHAQPNQSIFIPTCEGRRGNPVLFARDLFDTLLALTGDVGAKEICRLYPDKVHEVEVAEAGIFMDYDTPEALARLSASP